MNQMGLKTGPLVMSADGADAPRHRRRALPSTVCPALRAGHPADAADRLHREQARTQPAADPRPRWLEDQR